MISMSLPRNYCYENKIMQFVVACILIATLSLPVNASVGGHDLFTSLAQLEVLWKNEMQIINTMEDAIGKMETASNALKE